MEGTEKGDEASPPLQIDPKCFQDALRTFFQPIKINDPRLDFYTMYKREATEYDESYFKKYDDDLNITLLFAGLSSAVSATFVVDTHWSLQPDPNVQNTALLRAILDTLNSPGQANIIPPLEEDPSSANVTATCLMYASLLISLLAAFIAMLGKQWLNRYMSSSGGSMIERCGDRQRKCDGLKEWSLQYFVESLPMMLQASLLLLGCGICSRMWFINTPVARTLVSFAGLGVVFYIAIVIAGISSYACPFQTPVSATLHGPWKKVRPGIDYSIVRFKRMFSWAHRMWKLKVQPGLVPLIVHSKRVLSWANWMGNLLRRRRSPQTTTPLRDIQVQRSQSEPWLKPKDLAIIRRTNTDDVLCVSWILRTVIEPEVHDIALPLAGEIQWFDDGVDVNPPYDFIVSIFEACFDSTRRLYPGSRDRAYYAGRAILWIHTLAMCKSEDYAHRFPLLDIEYTTPVPDPDLEHLLRVSHVDRPPGPRIGLLLRIDPGQTPPHLQWTSNLLLHYSCANLTGLHRKSILGWFPNGRRTKTTIPLNTTLNRILVWCTLLGSPVEEEALEVQDKSDRMEPILDQLSKVVLPAISGTLNQQQLVADILYDLVRLETTPAHLTKITYEWCSVIYENRESVQNWEILLLLCLEIGFRHLDFQRQSIKATITHTEHHQGLVDVVLGGQEIEAIADLLHAWTTRSDSHAPAVELPSLCARHLVGLQNLVSSSSRLRRLVIRSVELTYHVVSREVGVERFIEFLNHLCTTAGDIDNGSCWIGVVWMLFPEEADPREGNLGDSMTLLFHQRPNAVQKLEQWIERWGREHNRVPKLFQQILQTSARGSQTGRVTGLIHNNVAESSAYAPPPVPLQPSGGNESQDLPPS